MLGLQKDFWIMWANDDAHSPPTKVRGKNATQVAQRFFADWPSFDGQFWVFSGKPVYTLDTSTPRRGHVYSGTVSGGRILRSLRARRRRR